MIGSRPRALVALALSQLRHHWGRGLLAVAGVALAVLLVTLLVALGVGVFTTGGDAIQWINRDLWVTGGGLGLQAGSVGGVENPIEGSHRVAASIRADERVVAAQPIALMSVYVSPNRSSFDTTIGVGTARSENPGAIDRADLFLNDSHYANGTYDGPVTREVVISPATADRYNLSRGDTLYVGGTLQSARETPFTVIAVSGRFSTFLGASAVAVPLSELQEITGTTGTDRAALIGVTLRSGTDADAVERDIEAANPTLEVRGNDEQLRRIVSRQAAVVVGVAALVVLAVVSGVALVVNVLATLVRSQQAELAALKAAGVAGRSLVAVVVVQGLLLGTLGGLVGVAVTPVAVDALNSLLASLSGFQNLATLAPWIYAVGGGLAVTVGTLGATVAGWQVARLSPLAGLTRP